MTRIISVSLFLAGLAVACFISTDHAESQPVLRRITNTDEEGINLNPAMSGDGLVVAFESTEDIVHAGGSEHFRAIRTNISAEPASFFQIAATRAVAPAISQDGSQIAWASTDDPLGTNPDGNSEIFLFDNAKLIQVTNTSPRDPANRITDGNFQPSISDDGRFIAFSSNRNPEGHNADDNFEIFVYDTFAATFKQLTSATGIFGFTDAKISGDGKTVVYVRNASRSSSPDLDLLKQPRTGDAPTVLAANIPNLALTFGRAISDDGTRVVYSAETALNTTQVFMHDARNGEVVRWITSLGARATEVPLQPTISGDGLRIAFAARRNVSGAATNNDGSVELYLYDLPTAQILRITSAPSSATADVVASMNDDGSIVVFNFPRLLSGGLINSATGNNSEIYVAEIPARPAFGTLSAVLNGASLGNEPSAIKAIAPDSIVTARGASLANITQQSERLANGGFPTNVGGTTVTVNGGAAQILFVSPTQVNFINPAPIEIGTAEVVVTNGDGFASRGQVASLITAPGIFTQNGNGTGDAVVLNSDTLQEGPFDPTRGQLRLTIFGTGTRRATQTFVNIAGRVITPDIITASPDLLGLDEIRFTVPSDLRGVGTVDLSIQSDERVSNPVRITFTGDSGRNILINEVLADPPDGTSGDANHDGVRDGTEDEFVELVNGTFNETINIGGWTLRTRPTASTTETTRFTFARGTTLKPGEPIVIFGGGGANFDPGNPIFGCAQVVKASTSSGLSLTNSGLTILLRDAAGNLITQFTYGGTTGLDAANNQSLTRSPDSDGTFVQHAIAAGANGRRWSPGLRTNGTPFSNCPGQVESVTLLPPSAIINAGETTQFTAQAFDQFGRPIDQVSFHFASDDTNVATINSVSINATNTIATAVVQGHTPGTAHITASSMKGMTVVNSDQSLIFVSAVSAPPTPTASPTATPTPAPTTTPTPTPTPAPIPTPTPTLPPLVISEFRTRGPSGANDDFIELYNSSDDLINISGWKVRGSSNAGTVTTKLTIAAGTSIPPRGHFLAANSAGYSGSTVADQNYTSALADDGGIAIVLPTDVVVDQAGMNSASAFKEGNVLTPLTTNVNRSYERRPGGTSGSTQDTGDNANDFQMLSPSDPQNLASPTTPAPTATPIPSPSPIPTITPTPAPEITPAPTPVVTPTPQPTATPTPIATATATPQPTSTPTPTPVPRAKVVISQVYGGGGNTGATFKNDFIEIFNAGNQTVSLTGWSVQYLSAAGTGTWAITVLSGSIAPGHYYLVQEAGGTAGMTDLPTPEITGTVNLAATAGKVALTNVASALSGGCPTDAQILDIVGYGNTATCFEGSGAAPAPATNNLQSIFRNSNGCADTDNNAADFTASTSSPRNSLSASNQCSAEFASEKAESWRFDIFDLSNSYDVFGRLSAWSCP